MPRLELKMPGKSDWGADIYPGLRAASTFYVVIPLAIALLYTLMRSGLAALMPFYKGLFLWTLLMLPGWWAAHGVATVMYHVLRPWTPPLWLICVLGSVGQALLLSPFYRTTHAWAITHLTTAGHVEGDWPLPAFTIAYAVSLLWVLAPGAIIWTAFNYFYDRVLDVPRFRYRHPATSGTPTPAAAPPDESKPSSSVEPAPAQAPAPPTLLTRSKLPGTAEILALTAEEHYVRLFTDVGTDLVRYRFSDALDEMSAVTGGMQVHRSWWVRTDRVLHWHVRGRSCELELDNQLRVPISLAFREAVLARAPTEVRDRARRGSQREVRTQQ